jgi:hypothetical protein
MTPSEIEPATFRLVTQCLNQLSYSVPRLIIGMFQNQEKGIHYCHFTLLVTTVTVFLDKQ